MPWKDRLQCTEPSAIIKSEFERVSISMIADNINNASIYYSCHSNFKISFEFLQKDDLEKLKPGTYEICGKDVFVLIQDVDTKPLCEGVFESHDKYIDIQYIIKYGECIGYANIKELQPKTCYDLDKDIRFYSGSGTMLELHQGDFMVFFPKDGHMPCISPANGIGISKKAVVKIHI